MKNFIAMLIVVLFSQCGTKEQGYFKTHKQFIKKIQKNDGDFYDLDKNVNHKDFSLPIGVFDSGIGGISVFDEILNADNYNEAGERVSDSVPDFKEESFIYMADQANMPYSNYVEVGKTDLLEEHVLKDFLFLVNRNYNTVDSEDIYKTKPTVKTIVIACNTATAYGKSFVEDFIEYSNINLEIIGVIDAGAKGALEAIEKNENATIAIFATPATVKSQAYVSTLTELIEKGKYGSNIQIVQQGGKGLHESIDNKTDFIGAGYVKPYPSYQGPSYSNPDYKIEKELLNVYKFDTLDHHLLYNNRYLFAADSVQINSIENYVRYHIVSLVEKINKVPEKQPLKAIILGCTHYPFVEHEINQVLAELKSTGRYEEVLNGEVVLIDPAKNTAIELYKLLSSTNLLNSNRSPAAKDLFFTSVPNTFNPKTKIDENGAFTYEYQYLSRNANDPGRSTLIVPFSEKVISKDQMKQIEEKYPKTFALITKGWSN